MSRQPLLKIVGPGLLVAATGVGAGDLASAGFAGSHLGVAILWAVLIGAFFKFVITEGLMRWQLATGQSLVQGIRNHLGLWAGWLFLPYLLLWSFFVGSALMSACGVTLHALLPFFDEAATAKIVFGIASSLAGLVLVWLGGFKLFEKVMSVCIGIMFLTVILCAVLVSPDLTALLKGMIVPTIPDSAGEGIPWTLALIGGVGGTVTILCYGYWILEEGRTQTSDLALCRIDLGIGYGMTAIFGVAMVIIGSSVSIQGGGAGLVVELGNQLETTLGKPARWFFLAGALGAVFSSLLGVWQSIPYLFADIWCRFLKPSSDQQNTNQEAVIDTGSLPYRGYLIALAFIPTFGLFFQFKEIQKLYGIIGATFVPLLTLVLIVLNGRSKWVKKYRNHPATVITLLSILGFFAWLAWASWTR